jgi:hypothetical protein
MSFLKLEVAKIVGVHSNSCWSQVHFFIPSDSQKIKNWGSLAAVFCLKALKEDLDISSFGKEVIQRFHESYYSSEKPVLGKLKEAINQLFQEFGQTVELSIIAASFLNSEKPAVYLASRGAQAKLCRDHKIALLLNDEPELKTASGFLKNNDLFILGSSHFFKLAGSKKLALIFKKSSFNQIKEELASLVGASEENSLVSLALVKIILDEEKIIDKPAVELEPDKNKLNFVFKAFRRIFSFFPKIKLPKGDDWQLFLKNRQPKATRKTQLTIALVLLVLLLVSIFLGYKKREQTSILEEKQEVIAKVEANLQEAQQLLAVSPERSKEFLIESQKVIKNYQDKKPEATQDEQLISLFQKITRELEKISHEYASQGELFLDLGLLKEGFKSQKWHLNGKEAVLLDKESGIVLKLNLETKKGQIIAGGQAVKKVNLVARNSGYSYLINSQEISLISEESLKEVDKKEIKDLGFVKDAVGFGGNLYLLSEDQIYKFVTLDDGLSDKQDFLTTNDDSLSRDYYLAIDGAIWTATKEGDISKFVRGKRDFFTVSGLDKNIFVQAFFTDENCQNLYILDRQNIRIVVINKEGQYQKSYFWPGLAGAYDLAVLEEQRKIFVLTGERVYEMAMN